MMCHKNLNKILTGGHWNVVKRFIDFCSGFVSLSFLMRDGCRGVTNFEHLWKRSSVKARPVLDIMVHYTWWSEGKSAGPLQCLCAQACLWKLYCLLGLQNFSCLCSYLKILALWKFSWRLDLFLRGMWSAVMSSLKQVTDVEDCFRATTKRKCIFVAGGQWDSKWHEIQGNVPANVSLLQDVEGNGRKCFCCTAWRKDAIQLKLVVGEKMKSIFLPLLGFPEFDVLVFPFQRLWDKKCHCGQVSCEKSGNYDAAVFFFVLLDWMHKALWLAFPFSAFTCLAYLGYKRKQDLSPKCRKVSTEHFAHSWDLDGNLSQWTLFWRTRAINVCVVLQRKLCICVSSIR